MKTLLRAFIPGRPRTKGSLVPVHAPGRGGRPCRVTLRESVGDSVPWKKTMMREMARVMGGAGRYTPHEEPVEVYAFARFTPRPAVGGGLWPSHQTPWPTADDIGDVDKLWRNVLDALTQAHVLADDRLVVGGSPYKRWCQPSERAGVLVVVRAADEGTLTRVLRMESEL